MKDRRCGNCKLCEESWKKYEETGIYEPMRCDNMHMGMRFVLPDCVDSEEDK